MNSIWVLIVICLLAVSTDVLDYIIDNWYNGKIIVPNWFANNTMNWVIKGEISEEQFLSVYEFEVSQGRIYQKDSDEPKEEKWSGWVTKPSGKVEEITLTLSTMQRLIDEKGWIFTKEKPPAPQPENENISIIFYTGTGGDLKRHFNINSIIVTPEEKEELAGWLYQNYGTSIILAVNRLTNDIRTHTAQQVKAYVLQKIQDDTPEEPLPPIPPPIPPTITGKSGIMGAGVAGAIGILILLGFVADSRRNK